MLIINSNMLIINSNMLVINSNMLIFDVDVFLNDLLLIVDICVVHLLVFTLDPFLIFIRLESIYLVILHDLSLLAHLIEVPNRLHLSLQLLVSLLHLRAF